MPILPDPTDGVAVRPDLLRSWTAALVGSVGTPDDIAADVAEILVAADRRGIPSHGTARLPNYLALVSAGVMDPAARPVAEVERAALVRYDARNGWGHHACRVATDRAIEMARTAGSAFVVLRNSNHYGIAGWYALRAAAAGMIGMSLSNTSPLVAPTRARVSMLGTNPIAVAAPAGRFGALCLDMATSTIPRGRIEVAARRGENLVEGWAIDAEGRPALTPEAALEGALMPLGGGEATAGYKGYGLALVVDMLTAVLAGATSGPSVIGLFSTEAPSDLGQAFWVVDPAALDGSAETFEQRLEALCADLITAPTAPGAPDRVLIPGEPEAAAERLAERRGVVIDGRHHAALVALADAAALPFPEVGPVEPAASPSFASS
jgi:LDH2 family malate/lactate/ureidoglycolate dehydrogenase